MATSDVARHIQMFYYVYILFSQKDRKLYFGFTENLQNRVKEHQNKKVRSTRNRAPLTLIHFEAFKNKKDAKSREKFLKSGFGRSQFKRALQNIFSELKYGQK